MGANQSRSETDEKVFPNETPISFSPDVVNQLSDRLESPETSPGQQSVLDAHIRARIHGELEHLRKEEEVVRQAIENALEKENLDRERSMTSAEGDEGGIGEVRSSAVLLGDLEEVRNKIDKYKTRKDLSEYPEIKESGQAVIECYKKNTTTPLDCWREVDKFKASVGQLEQQYFKTV